MKPKTNKTVRTLNSLISRRNWGVETAKAQVGQARNVLESAQDALQDINERIDRLEEQIRGNSAAESILSLTSMQFQQRFLQEQGRIKQHKQMEHRNAEQTFDAATRELQHQKQELRLLEKLHERKIMIINKESSKVMTKEMDELWLQRRTEK